jgi:hypothetical protein
VSRRVAALALTVLAVAAGCAVAEPTPPAADPSDFADIPGIGLTRVDVPRPSGAASAACDGDPLPPSTTETTAQRIAGLRAAGLFADRTGVTDTELAAEVDQKLTALWGDALPTDDPLRDLAVAEQDASRVLWIDLEADVAGGSDVYVATLDQLEGIGVGDFEPVGIIETWDAEEGPITVGFDLGGAHHELRPAYLEDWIDPGILVGINEAIADTGRRFELYRAFDQTALIVALTDIEREALEVRGWCFE